jgi:hypothetical protein
LYFDIEIFLDQQNNPVIFQAYTEMITERRKKVSSGAEDTYGMEKM